MSSKAVLVDLDNNDPDSNNNNHIVPLKTEVKPSAVVIPLTRSEPETIPWQRNLVVFLLVLVSITFTANYYVMSSL